jgi:hypothetical protein
MLLLFTRRSSDYCCHDYPRAPQKQNAVIITLSLTILIEGIIACGFALWQKKPVGRLLAVSVLANILTQSMLWGALKLLPHAYLLTLFTMEFFIWLIESAIFRHFPGTHLTWREALSLSLGMNLASFGIGWFLPV